MARRQKLLTAALRKALPALYATEKTPLDEKIVVARFFNPYGSGSWFILEFDGEDTMFGGVDIGMTDGDPELGYISLSELEALPARICGRWVNSIQGIERDIHFTPKTWKEAMAEHNAVCGRA